MKALFPRLSLYLLIVAAASAGARRAPSEPAMDEQQTIPLSEDREVMVTVPRGFLLSKGVDARGMVVARITDVMEHVALEITFLPDTEGRFAEGFARKELMHELYQEYLRGSVEKAMQFEELETRFGKATYCVFTDAKLVGRSDAPPPGEYLNATAGVKAWPGVVALFTILSNGTKSKEYLAALAILRDSVHERIAPLR